MRALVLLSLLPVLLVTSISCAASSEGDRGAAGTRPVVLVLVDELAWEEVRETPYLEETFEDSAVSNLSTAQGAASADFRMGYVLLGAGSRVDTSLLPENLPREPAGAPEVFEGPASSIQPGALGGALAEEGVKVAAIGEPAELVVMDREGMIPRIYTAREPVRSIGDALAEGAEFVAVDAGRPEQAGRISEAAREAGAVVAVVSPNAPADSANLTPLALTGTERGLLYSPTTRTRGLISSSDVAPTLLAEFGIEPPPEMQGRVATVVPGTAERAEELEDRLSFVAEKQAEVWLLAGTALASGLLLFSILKGKAGAATVLLALAALPAGALVVAVVPPTSAPAVAALIVILGGVLAGLSRWLSGSVFGAAAAVYLATATLILADTAVGGMLMKLSVLGYNPAFGARFYGIGNEYAAVLAGSLTMGLGALAYRRRLPTIPVLVAGAVAVLVLGLPTMGADVGGSLALGFGLGATVGVLRGSSLRGVALWAGCGLALAAALFLLSGRLFPGVSHGSQAAGGETGLSEVLVRKLLLSLGHLANPFWALLLLVLAAVVYAGWRRARGTALAAGMVGATVTALASGALNDSGITVVPLALAYPAVAAILILPLGSPWSGTSDKCPG